MPNLASKYLCTGCTACYASCPTGCITMAADSDGFRFPEVNSEICIGCSLCEKTCPVLTRTELYGEDPTAYAAYSKDEAVRIDSSSGGVFSELARVVLAQRGVVFGAAYNEQFDVAHVCAEDEAGLAKFRGAKYVQSELGNTFADIKGRLENGQLVLFSGTPCQVAGLKSFLRKEYKNLITVDFICHGVPSPMAWREYVKYRAQQDHAGELPKFINLRSKESGWSNYSYSNLFLYSDGSSHADRSGESLFMKLFIGNYINRESCSNCLFKGYRRTSDLTIGDFWGIWDIVPEMDDNRGTSVILCQSHCGAKLLNTISDKLIMKQVTLADASTQNRSMLISSTSNPARREALDMIQSGNIAACENLFQQSKKTMLQKLWEIVGRILPRN